MIGRLAIAAALTASLGAEARELVFTACPVYRDTDNGRKSGCWLAVDPASGVRYDVSAAPTKPDWNRAILVEGRTEAGAGDPCGGVVLGPVRVSVLDTPCTRHALPAEGYKGRRFELPARNVRPLYEPRPAPPRPFAEKRFTIPFDFGSSFIVYQLGDYYLDQMINYALDTGASRIVIAGGAQRGTGSMAEEASLAATRADTIREALILRGIPAQHITMAPPTSAPFVADAFDGLDAPAARRVDIRVIP